MQSSQSRPAFIALLVVVIWAPWPLGSNRPWALALLAAMIWAPLILLASQALVRAVRSGEALHWSAQSGWVCVPTTGFACFAAVALVQLLPLGLGPVDGRISVDPFATRNYLFSTLTYFGAWLLVLFTVDSQRRARVLTLTVLGSGIAQALFAVALHAARAKYFLFDADFVHGVRAQGTYPNPDHLAGYMELCLSAAVGYLLARFAAADAPTDPSWRGQLVRALRFLLSTKMVVRMLSVVMVVALVMTHSRMGNVAFFTAMLVGAGVIAATCLKMRKPALWLLASMIVVDILVIGQWVGIDRVAERLANTVQAGAGSIDDADELRGTPVRREDSLQQRLQIPGMALAMVQERPMLGFGGGTFAFAFPPYKVEPLPYNWDFAHNDYVQVAAEMGLVGLGCWLTIGIASCAFALWTLRKRQSPEALGAGAAVILASISIGLHSMVDFNLHVPSNAVTFVVILALVWAIPARHAGRSSRKAESKRTQPRLQSQ